MARDEVVVYERIKQGLCPICGEKIIGSSTLVLDPKFGDVLICSRHITQGSNKLVE